MQTTRIAIALGLLVLALPGCHATDPRAVLERRPGVLSIGDEPSVTAPGEAAAGAPIAVTVVTWGGGCARQGGTEASVNALAADVTPYDSVYVVLPPNMACTADLRRYTHTATVTFAAAGTAVLRVHGWSEPANAMMVVERTIQVR
jgi:hypothetical protein